MATTAAYFYQNPALAGGAKPLTQQVTEEPKSDCGCGCGGSGGCGGDDAHSHDTQNREVQGSDFCFTFPTWVVATLVLVGAAVIAFWAYKKLVVK